MSDRRRRLQSLVIQDPCTESWAGMEGDDRRRHCAKCDKDVHDFAQLTPREITRRIQRARGSLCARLTWDERGRLVTQPEVLVPSTWEARRPSPLAAAVVSLLLGAPAASALPASEPAATAPRPDPAPGETVGKDRPEQFSLRGALIDDQFRPVAGAEMTVRNLLDGAAERTLTDALGRFRFKDLGAGLYLVEGTRAGFEVHPVADLLLTAGETAEVVVTADSRESGVMGGAMGIGEDPLHERYFDSELVILGRAGATVPADPADPEAGWITEVVDGRVIRGSRGGRAVRVWHDGGWADDQGTFPPGTFLLGFLARVEAPDGGQDLWEVAPGSFQLEALTARAAAVYGERLSALAELEPGSASYPEDLAAWLVTTAVAPEPLEEGVPTLARAFYELDRLATARGRSPLEASADLAGVYRRFVAAGGTPAASFPPALLAAFVTEAHQAQLTTALAAAKTLTWQHNSLARLVRRWNPEAALGWQLAQLREGAADPEDLTREVMRDLTLEARDPALTTLVREGVTALDHLPWGEAGGPARAQLLEELRERFLARIREVL